MIDDEMLRKVLKQKINLIKEYPRSLQKKVEIEMANRYNVKFGDVVDTFNNLSPNKVEELPYTMLFKLAICIHEVTINSEQKIDSSDLDVKQYFTQQECEEFDSPFPEEEKDFDLVITDWKQISEEKIKIYTNIDEVITWRNFNKLRFNPETQRDLITIISHGKNKKVLDINRNAVNEMKYLMKKGMYFNVCGILNINPEISPLPYKDGRNLIIPMESHIDLIEGFHNYLAETELKDEDPNFMYDIEFDLMLLNTERANDLIIQMDKKTHFRPQQIIRNDRLNEINYIVNTLNTRPSYHLYGTIDNDVKIYLIKLIKQLFGIITEREQSLQLLLEIEKDLNYVIEKYKHFKPLSKKEYFIVVNMIRYSKDKDIDFNTIVNYFDDFKTLTNDLKLYEITIRNIKTFNKYIEEVMKNVL